MRRHGSRLTAHVALITVCVLASVVACSEDNRPITTPTAADSADQVIFGLSHYLTLDGVPRAKLDADTAYFYQTSQRADLLHIHVTFYAADGSIASTLTARAGKYEWRTGNMRAMGNVVSITPDGRKLTTDTLDYVRATNQISGPNAFVFDAPGRHLEGESFTSDPDFKNVLTTKPRKGTLGSVDLNKK